LRVSRSRPREGFREPLVHQRSRIIWKTKTWRAFRTGVFAGLVFLPPTPNERRGRPEFEPSYRSVAGGRFQRGKLQKRGEGWGGGGTRQGADFPGRKGQLGAFCPTHGLRFFRSGRSRACCSGSELYLRSNKLKGRSASCIRFRESGVKWENGKDLRTFSGTDYFRSGDEGGGGGGGGDREHKNPVNFPEGDGMVVFTSAVCAIANSRITWGINLRGEPPHSGVLRATSFSLKRLRYWDGPKGRRYFGRGRGGGGLFAGFGRQFIDFRGKRVLLSKTSRHCCPRFSGIGREISLCFWFALVRATAHRWGLNRFFCPDGARAY